MAEKWMSSAGKQPGAMKMSGKSTLGFAQSGRRRKALMGKKARLSMTSSKFRSKG